MSVKFDVIKELTWRGMLNQVTDEKMGEFLMAKPRTIYTGFDPTADSLHVGHLVAIMNLRRFQKAGHRPIPLVGGATGMIGDPSGRSDERNLLTEDQVRHNVECIKKQLSRFVDFESKENGAILVNNYDWMKDYSFLNFLRDIGKMFQVNVMMTKDSVKSRLESENGLSYTEFSYMLLQSYDFVHLCREYGCEIQAGGSDQWGNITAGIDLARRMLGVQLYGFTSKLLLKSDGKKMGKSESGALWLDPNRTSPYQFYQYWVNVDDADIENAFKFFTDMTEEEATALIAEHREHLGQRVLQKQVASAFCKSKSPKSLPSLRTASRAWRPRKRRPRSSSAPRLKISPTRNLRPSSPTFRAKNFRANSSTTARSGSSTRSSSPAWPRRRATPGAPYSRAARTSITSR